MLSEVYIHQNATKIKYNVSIKVNIVLSNSKAPTSNVVACPFYLYTWIYFNPDMDKWSHAKYNGDEITYPSSYFNGTSADEFDDFLNRRWQKQNIH